MTYGRGFYNAEPGDDGAEFRWMGPAGLVQLRNDHKDMVLTFRLRLPLDKLAEKPVVRIELNGTLLDELASAQEVTQGRYEVPAARLGAGPTVELRFQTTQTFVPRDLNPNSADIRRLGLTIQGLDWTPK